MAGDLMTPGPDPSAGSVRLLTVAEARGASADHVILANLAEGTFPSRAAVSPDLADPSDEEDATSLGREMARFLDVVGSARKSLSLVYPSADEKGQSLLPAGFLDDVRRLFDAPSWSRLHDSFLRLDPVLPPDLAVAPPEARVRAVALACLRDDFRELDELAKDARHRPALDAAATALRLARWRQRKSRFGPFDGMLSDPRAAEKIAQEYGPGRLPISPSQLESFASCPFQFFQKYILRLDPGDVREELQDDYAGRGSLIHSALESLHTRIRDLPAEPGQSQADRVESGIDATIAFLVANAHEPTSEIEAGLRLIEAERLRRIGRRYAIQFRKYAERDGRESRGHLFEIGFGRDEEGVPAMTIGTPPRSIAIQGFIDRIDLVEREGRALFRIIDYKTGSCPSKGDITSGEVLQLPLYALAAERVILSGRESVPLDAAYWGLKDSGFKRMHTMAVLSDGTVTTPAEWETYRDRLEAYLLELIDSIRSGAFPVSPRKSDCQARCEYRNVCRIVQVRRARKTWDAAPRLEAAP